MDVLYVPGLWEKHNVYLLHASDGEPYVFRFTSIYNPENLNELIEAWLSKMTTEEKKRARVGDREQNRVGFVRVDRGRDAHLLDSVAMSWNQILMLRRVSSKVPINERIDHVGMSVLLKTSDDRIVLSKRSNKVETHQCSWGVSAAGMMDYNAASFARTGFPQVFVELNEEAGILPQEVSDLRTLGLVKNIEHECAGIEMCFSANVKLTAEQLLERASKAVDSWEGKHSCFARDEVDKMLKTEKFSPVGAGCLMLSLGI